jgi:hypothetical protein
MSDLIKATPIHDVEFVNEKGLLQYAKAGIATDFPKGEFDKLVEAGSIKAPKNKTEEKALERAAKESPTVDPVVDTALEAKASKAK